MAQGVPLTTDDLDETALQPDRVPVMPRGKGGARFDAAGPTREWRFAAPGAG